MYFPSNTMGAEIIFEVMDEECYILDRIKVTLEFPLATSCEAAIAEYAPRRDIFDWARVNSWGVGWSSADSVMIREVCGICHKPILESYVEGLSCESLGGCPF